MSGFASVIIDVDSTLSGIEGVDWLAARRGPDVGARVAALTSRAMRGEIALDAIYGERLAIIRPTRAEVRALGAAYATAVAPGAREVVGLLRAAGIDLVLVSGGLRAAIAPWATAELGFIDADVHAVRICFDASGEYAGFDAASPLATQTGKCALIAGLSLPRPSLMVGDGATDAAARPAVDAFAAFTGFVCRDAVVRVADHVLSSFDQLLELVLA